MRVEKFFLPSRLFDYHKIHVISNKRFSNFATHLLSFAPISRGRLRHFLKFPRSENKRERQQAGHAWEHPHPSAIKIAEHPQGGALTLLVLRQHLAAGATGRRLTEPSLGITPHDGQRPVVTAVRPLCRGGEDSRAFRRQARRIGHILLVAAHNDSAVRQT